MSDAIRIQYELARKRIEDRERKLRPRVTALMQQGMGIMKIQRQLELDGFPIPFTALKVLLNKIKGSP